MRRYRAHFPVIPAIALVSLGVYFSSGVARAEIYKWVDADGKIHFGDKPEDAAEAAKAKPVELGYSYEPYERTPQEQAAFELQQRSLRLNTQERTRVDKEQRDAATVQRAEEKTEQCKSYALDLGRLVGSDDSRIFYYVKDENGESVSEDRQTEIIEEIKAKMAALDCP